MGNGHRLPLGPVGLVTGVLLVAIACGNGTSLHSYATGGTRGNDASHSTGGGGGSFTGPQTGSGVGAATSQGGSGTAASGGYLPAGAIGSGGQYQAGASGRDASGAGGSSAANAIVRNQYHRDQNIELDLSDLATPDLPQDTSLDAAVEFVASDVSIVDSWIPDAALVDCNPDLRVFSCDDWMDWTQPLDDSAAGFGACASNTLGSLIDDIKALHPDLADIERTSPPDGFCGLELPPCVPETNIAANRYGGGFRIVMVRFSEVSMLKFHRQEYWYFETDDQCSPQQVGYFRDGASDCGGSSLWNYPRQGRYCQTQTCGLDAGARD